MIKKIKLFIISTIIAAMLYFLYSYIPYRIEFYGHYDKIWAHRNNSIKKANITEKYFKGIELDLYYQENGNFLDVNHPPAKSIHLSFSDFLAALKRQPFLWLDIKNLNSSNSQVILLSLQKALQKHHYPIYKILIETRFPKVLPPFTKLGFRSSYYLPYLFNIDSVNRKKELLSIQKNLKQQNDIGISFNYNDYELIHKLYPNRIKYTWIIDGLRHRNFNTSKKILNDTTVKVVLIRIKTLKGHR